MKLSQAYAQGLALAQKRDHSVADPWVGFVIVGHASLAFFGATPPAFVEMNEAVGEGNDARDGWDVVLPGHIGKASAAPTDIEDQTVLAWGKKPS